VSNLATNIANAGYATTEYVDNAIINVETEVQNDLVSTVVGLGTAGYVSTSQLLSTSLGIAEYISTFINPDQLTSTVIGLGTAGFVSSLGLNDSLASTVQGLGSAGYISSGQLLSTSLGLSNYVNTFVTPPNLTSTIIGLGTAGYVSTLVNVPFTSTQQATMSSFSGNLADALTVILFDW
jgi:hypothetical protein